MRVTGIRVASLSVVFLLAVGVSTALAQDAESESIARKKYEMGLQFMREKNYAEAVKEFKATVELYGRSRVADSALLQIAEYYLNIAGDLAAAQAAVDTLTKTYEKTNSGPMAYVLAGRIILERSRAPGDVKAALANYTRVQGYFPGSDAVPASMYFAGEAYRLTHRDDEAIKSFRDVWTDYPDSEWAPRAMLGEAQCLAQTGKATRAIEVLQRVRQRFPNGPEAATAVAWNTILYRLHLRAPAQQAFQFAAQKSIGGPSGRLKDIKTIAFSPGPDGSLHVATPDGVFVYDVSGRLTAGPAAKDVRSITFDRMGQPVLICKEAVVSKEMGSRSLSIKKSDGTFRSLNDVPTGVRTSGGDLLVGDSNAKEITRFSRDGKHIGPFAAVSPGRLAIDVSDRVASIDEDGSGVSIYDDDRRARPKIPSRGPGWEFKRPVDVAFDPLGHVYVLDRNAATVWVFAQSPHVRLLTGFAIPAKSPGVFRGAVCFALDAAGRLYIYDDGVEKIQVYQ